LQRAGFAPKHQPKKQRNAFVGGKMTFYGALEQVLVKRGEKIRILGG